MKINLQELAGGAVSEKFNRELQKVLNNIADPNTDAGKVRTIELKIKLKADEKRDVINATVSAVSKLAPAKEVETKIMLGRDNAGRVVGAELKSGIPGQTFIDEAGDVAEDDGTKIIDLRKVKGGNE
jgi:hypothetical protein